MDLSSLKSKTPRKKHKRIGRGGKRGTTSGSGTKGQKSRAGASVRPGFRGGDNRIWQLFPKQRGATKKHGNKSPHKKHRFFSVKNTTAFELKLRALDVFKDGETVSLATLIEKGLAPQGTTRVKILSTGDIKRKLMTSGVMLSAAAKKKIEDAGGTVGL
ncbi:MAG: 50S ribosomal protein L15 [Candidatus Yanofskybacteria bacterium]|nr:50S ribosomal protein L15 [Candidatus Yanofskybacteria bacterium]